jgi:NTE family protein
MTKTKFYLLLPALFFALSACQSTETKNESPVDQKHTAPMPPPALTPTEVRDIVKPSVTLSPTAPVVEVPANLNLKKEKPKVALILGPGGLRAFAHAGVLQEFHRAKFPLFAVGGLEAGALPAALFTSKPQAFEVEWQMMKLKEDDFFESGLMSGKKPKDLKDWQDLLKGYFAANRIEDSRISFGCITTQMDKNLPMVISKGTFEKFLPYCLAFPPLFKSFDRHIAGAQQLTSLIQHFKSKGANYFIYVDLLSDKQKKVLKSDENLVLWNQIAQSLQLQQVGAHEVIRIPISDELTAFSARRELVQKGREATTRAVQNLMSKLGLD